MDGYAGRYMDFRAWDTGGRGGERRRGRSPASCAVRGGAH